LAHLQSFLYRQSTFYRQSTPRPLNGLFCGLAVRFLAFLAVLPTANPQKRHFTQCGWIGGNLACGIGNLACKSAKNRE
jgi:hypothetical protein